MLKSTTGTAEREQPPIEAAHLDHILQNPAFQTDVMTRCCPECDWEVYFANGKYNTSGFQFRVDQEALEKGIPGQSLTNNGTAISALAGMCVVGKVRCNSWRH